MKRLWDEWWPLAGTAVLLLLMFGILLLPDGGAR